MQNKIIFFIITILNNKIATMVVNLEEFKQFILEKLDKSKIENIDVINVEEKTSLMKYLIIGTGIGERHIESTADNLREDIKQEFNFIPKPPQGKSSGWVVMDLNDIFVNLFTTEERERYNLEDLWKK